MWWCSGAERSCRGQSGRCIHDAPCGSACSSASLFRGEYNPCFLGKVSTENSSVWRTSGSILPTRHHQLSAIAQVKMMEQESTVPSGCTCITVCFVRRGNKVLLQEGPALGTPSYGAGGKIENDETLKWTLRGEHPNRFLDWKRCRFDVLISCSKSCFLSLFLLLLTRGQRSCVVCSPLGDDAVADSLWPNVAGSKVPTAFDACR
jgi:hypothetical protein